MNRGLSRRRFLKMAAGGAGAATALSIVPAHVLGGPGKTPPSEVVTRGVIGCGAMGMAGHVKANPPNAPPFVLAVCDVDSKRLERGLAMAGKGCEGYSDWRRVIERKDIDTIHVPTPPHWHALISIAACQAGKDVFSEKPMTRFIAEGQAVIRAVRRYGRMYSINCSPRAGWEPYRKLVASGILGTPLTAYLSPEKAVEFKVKNWSGSPNPTPQPVPPELDYNMWLGPAPYKPYHPGRVHSSFRGYWDYDAGGLGDMGQHYLDSLQYVLGKDDTGPVEVEAYAPFPAHPDAAGMWGRITYRYADGTTIILESGEWGEPPTPRPFLQGPKGRIWQRREKMTDEDREVMSQLAGLPDVPPLRTDFATAVRTRRDPDRQPCAEHAHRSVSLIHLSTIAIRTGRTIHWDPVKEQVIGDEQANALVNIPMRAPWHL
jgi:predicted dehydrogenase